MLKPTLIITGNYLAHFSNYPELLKLISTRSFFDQIRFLSYRDTDHSSPFKSLTRYQLMILELKVTFQNMIREFLKTPEVILLKPTNDVKIPNLVFVEAS